MKEMKTKVNFKVSYRPTVSKCARGAVQVLKSNMLKGVAYKCFKQTISYTRYVLIYGGSLSTALACYYYFQEQNTQ